MAPPRLPDLALLTDAQKDALIVSLWETLVATETPVASATEAQVASAPAAPAATEALRRRLAATAPSRRAQAPASARSWGAGLLESRLLLAVLILIGLGFLADTAIGWYEQRVLAARAHAALELRNAAFGSLYVELVRVAYEPDGRSYRVRFTMRNSNDAVPLFIMLNPVRVFVQTGLTWREVPARAPEGAAWGVVRLDGAGEYGVVFRADVKDWAELIPGYMHIRIESDMLISRSSAPREDIIERANRFNVYLKPQGADDAAIRLRSNFPGPPPVFIPMPPH